MKEEKAKELPQFFQPILWSYDFMYVDPQKDKRAIIVNALNYGDLKHWRWISQFYGKVEVQKFLGDISPSEIRPRVRHLVALLFHIKEWNDARGSIG
ncbi:MAG: hypothetical protein Q8O97_02610 [bacterium]|nr:hypothetical protein [Candidatus Wildermuthbacteria bacterium]MDP2664825.1 hypothetical protein [bacterium]